jgi:uncharacterized coiled-coil protein SlyX
MPQFLCQDRFMASQELTVVMQELVQQGQLNRRAYDDGMAICTRALERNATAFNRNAQALVRLDQRIAGLDQRIAGLDQRIMGLDQRIAGLEHAVTELVGVVRVLAEAVRDLRSEVRAQTGAVFMLIDRLGGGHAAA